MIFQNKQQRSNIKKIPAEISSPLILEFLTKPPRKLMTSSIIWYDNPTASKYFPKTSTCRGVPSPSFIKFHCKAVNALGFVYGFGGYGWADLGRRIWLGGFGGFSDFDRFTIIGGGADLAMMGSFFGIDT
jgi:hypothetical protein